MVFCGSGFHETYGLEGRKEGSIDVRGSGAGGRKPERRLRGPGLDAARRRHRLRDERELIDAFQRGLLFFFSLVDQFIVCVYVYVGCL